LVGVAAGAAATIGLAGWGDRPTTAAVRVGAATVQVRASGCGPDLAATGVRLADGRVLTNRHAVVGEQVAVDGEAARSVEVASSADLAAIVTERAGVGVEVASEHAAPGDEVWTASRRDGHLSVTAARITSAVRGTGADDPPFAWRLDRAVQPGDSGSPVVNAHGDLVGIVYAAERGSTAALVVPISQLDRERFSAPACG
jgi:S1-C subfamily serine protease